MQHEVPITGEPPRTGRLARFIGRLWLRVFGWKLEGALPPCSHAVVIAAPHTSNWDMPFMLAVGFAFGMRVSWLGKKEIFSNGFGPFFRWLGGIPVDRRAASGMVDQVVDSFRTSDDIYLVVPPSGTRSATDHWKSGFYHIARRANVPMICSYLDYKRKAGGVGPAFMPTDDLKADMDRLRAFYAGVTPRYPANEARVRLREEDSPKDEAA